MKILEVFVDSLSPETKVSKSRHDVNESICAKKSSRLVELQKL